MLKASWLSASLSLRGGEGKTDAVKIIATTEKQRYFKVIYGNFVCF